MTIYWPSSHPPAKTKGRKTNYTRLHGFSLVEVTLALGICSFCLVAVIGLMPIGVTTNRNTLEQTAAAAVAREVVADFWGVSSTVVAADVATGKPASTSRYNIPLPGTTTAASSLPADTLFLAEDGTKMPGFTGARYRVDVAYGARTSVNQPTPIRVLVTWPAAANPSTGSWPTNVSGEYQAVTVLNTY